MKVRYKNSIKEFIIKKLINFLLYVVSYDFYNDLYNSSIIFLVSLYKYVESFYQQKKYSKDNKYIIGSFEFFPKKYFYINDDIVSRLDINQFGSLNDQCIEIYSYLKGIDYIDYGMLSPTISRIKIKKDRKTLSELCWDDLHPVTLYCYGTGSFVCDHFLNMIDKKYFKDNQGKVLTSKCVKIVKLSSFDLNKIPNMNYIQRIILWFFYCVNIIRIPKTRETESYPFIFSDENIFDDLNKMKNIQINNRNDKFDLRKSNDIYFENYFWKLFCLDINFNYLQNV